MGMSTPGDLSASYAVLRVTRLGVLLCLLTFLITTAIAALDDPWDGVTVESIWTLSVVTVAVRWCAHLRRPLGTTDR